MSNYQDYLIQTALVAHNKLREQHGAPPLKHNPEISKIALKWAENLAKNNKFEHSSNDQRKYRDGTLGENLWMGSDGQRPEKIDGSNATNDWYNEINDYNWSKPGFSMETGHFTQVVWKKSLEMGIGVAVGDDNSVVVCANYFPAGNMMSAFEENVGRKSSNNFKKPDSVDTNKDTKENQNITSTGADNSACCSIL